jgi:hypothetical protein
MGPTWRLDRMTNTRGAWTPHPCPSCGGTGTWRGVTAPGAMLAHDVITGRPNVVPWCLSCRGAGREPVRVFAYGRG